MDFLTELSQKLDKLQDLVNQEKLRLEREGLRVKALAGDHRFYYYDCPEGIRDVELIPCEGCGKLRGHAIHRADLVAFYGEEAYNRYYKQ